MQDSDGSTNEQLTQPILEILDNHHSGGITPEDCIKCSSLCCGEGGFAILENVEAIYERYVRGGLSRTDYDFPVGLSFRDFVAEYFDVYRYDVPETNPGESIVLFYMRSLSQCGNTISIPPVPNVRDYAKVRKGFFGANGWMNSGCVFLSHRLSSWPDDDAVGDRHCILHDRGTGQSLGAKPIDCVFHTCETPRVTRRPTVGLSEDWFAELARQWPGSVERFHQRVMS